MDTKRLNNLNELFQREIEKNHLRDAAVLVYQGGEVCFQNEYGSYKDDTIYKIYSMTKPITAVAVMILFERGLLDVADPVSDYLPSFSELTVEDEYGVHKAKEVMTINHLLNMTSGIVYPGDEDGPARAMARKQGELLKTVKNGKKLDTISICKALGECPLAFEPGTKWRYGASADILGAIVEVVSGMKYGEFLKKEIFEPLHMDETGFLIPEGKLSRFATFYSADDGQQELRNVTEEERMWLGITNPAKAPNIESGGGGLYSTRNDYLQFAKMLLGKGSLNGVKILGEKTVEYMTQNQLTSEQAVYFNWDQLKGFGYGNLMRTKVDTVAALSNGSIGEFGWDGLAGTYFTISPKDDLIILYMQQHKHGADYTLRRKMRNIIFGALD